MNYARPDNLETALDLLAQDKWLVLSGGTDFYPAHSESAIEGPVLDISAVGSLRGVSETTDHWRIGALTTWSDVVSAELPPAFDGLKLAAREVGSIQIQNRATIAGNLCNASPAADGVPPLLVLDAKVELSSSKGSRNMPLSEFITGNRQTKLNPDELLTAVTIPKSSTSGRSAFLKLGARKYLVISIVMVASRLSADDEGRISEAAISVGSCSVVAQRLSALEDALIGADIGNNLAELVKADHFAGLSPIDDVRAPASYRIDGAAELTRRAIMIAAGAP